jgi:hypothetical protein
MKLDTFVIRLTLFFGMWPILGNWNARYLLMARYRKDVHVDRGQTNKETNKPHDISFRNNKLIWWSWTENINIRYKELGKQVHKYTVVVGENCRVCYHFRGDRRKVTVMRPDFVLILYFVSHLLGRKVCCLFDQSLWWFSPVLWSETRDLLDE